MNIIEYRLVTLTNDRKRNLQIHPRVPHWLEGYVFVEGRKAKASNQDVLENSTNNTIKKLNSEGFYEVSRSLRPETIVFRKGDF